jgi:hypothetical protein
MPQRPGRPPLDANSPSVHVNVRVPARQYDELYAEAQRRGLSVPEVIRRQGVGIQRPKSDPDPEDCY